MNAKKYTVDTLEPVSMADGRTVTMIVITSLLILIALIGLLIENTSLGTKS